MNFVDNLPAIRNARLPQTYDAAKRALAECSRIDECQDWADKAEALASYARQARDNEMRRMADQIQARAVRRSGELLREIKPAVNQFVSAKRAAVGAVTRTQAAKNAGMSERQQITAIRVAKIPEKEFEELVESEKPPTVTALAERGKKHRMTEGMSKKPLSKAERVERIRELAERGFKSDQIAAKIEVSPNHTRELAREAGIRLPDALIGRVRKLDVNRMVDKTVMSAQSLTTGLELIDSRMEGLDLSRIDEWVTVLTASVGKLNYLILQLKRRSNGNVQQNGTKIQ